MEAQIPLTAVSLRHSFSHGEVADGFYGDFNDALMFPDHIPWNATGLAYRSREPSVVAPKPPKSYPSTEEWNNIRPIFTKLYSTENGSLTDVKNILEKDHGFVATERMYKDRITKWDLQKNLKKAEKAKRIQKLRQTGHEDQLLRNGRLIVHRLKRHCKENKISLEVLETITRNVENGKWTSFGDVNQCTEAGALCLQSLFRSSTELSPPVALYGEVRTAEFVIWNAENYLNSYFTDGPGTRYFKVDPTAAAHKGLPSQSLLLVRSREAWNEVWEPRVLFNRVSYALEALDCGFLSSAVAKMDQAFALVEVLFRQAEPTLLSYLLAIVIAQTSHDSNLARKITSIHS